MDFTKFIGRKDQIECAKKAGLYCVLQSHLPPQFQAFRCGLAGKPVDSATQFKSAEGNFSSRFAQYLNYWMPTDAKVFACLTVPRKSILGFAERVMPEILEGDNREEYARLHLGKTLIQIRERQYHQLLVKYGMRRLGLPTTEVGKERGEFFRGDLQTCIRALRSIGTGDLYIFKGNNIDQIEKITLKKRGIDQTAPDQVTLRANPDRAARPDKPRDDDEFSVTELDDEDVPNPNSLDEDDLPLNIRADKLTIDRIVNDPSAARAIDQLRQVRRSPRLAVNEPIVVNMDQNQLNRVRRRSPRAMRAVQALQQVRRSPRMNN